MKKYLAILFSAFAVFAAPAFAQPAAVDPAAAEAAKQLFQAMNLKEVMIQMIQQGERSVPQMMRSIVTGDQKMTPEKKEKAVADLEKSLPKMAATLHNIFSDPSMLDELLAEMIPVYANYYTVDEMHQLAVFYQSPLGQKMQASLPKMAAANMLIYTRVMLPRMQKLLQEEAKGVVANQP